MRDTQYDIPYFISYNIYMIFHEPYEFLIVIYDLYRTLSVVYFVKYFDYSATFGTCYASLSFVLIDLLTGLITFLWGCTKFSNSNRTLAFILRVCV